MGQDPPSLGVCSLVWDQDLGLPNMGIAGLAQDGSKSFREGWQTCFSKVELLLRSRLGSPGEGEPGAELPKNIRSAKAVLGASWLSLLGRCLMQGRWQHLPRSCCGLARTALVSKLSLSRHISDKQNTYNYHHLSRQLPERSREMVAARNCIRPPRCLHKARKQECCLAI